MFIAYFYVNFRKIIKQHDESSERIPKWFKNRGCWKSPFFWKFLKMNHVVEQFLKSFFANFLLFQQPQSFWERWRKWQKVQFDVRNRSSFWERWPKLVRNWNWLFQFDCLVYFFLLVTESFCPSLFKSLYFLQCIS